MALLVSDHDGNSPKVWQPWYINESEGVHKELPSRIHREQRIKDRTHLCKQSKLSPNMNNQKEMEPTSRRVYGPPEYIGNVHNTTTYNEDLPLDMSMKKRCLSPNHSVSITNSQDRLMKPSSSIICNPPLQALANRTQLNQPHSPAESYFRGESYDESEAIRDRPSVITCASTRYLQDYSPLPVEQKNPLPPPPSYSSATAYLRESSSINVTEFPSFQEVKKIRAEYPKSLPPVEHPVEITRNSSKISSKKKIVEGNAEDPDIDEHFRRSLGTQYKQLFVSLSPEEESDSNDSVDDHFTKALGGETWKKLKGNKTEAHCERPSERFASLQEASNSFRGQTPPDSVFEETADVSITRISLPSNIGHGS